MRTSVDHKKKLNEDKVEAAKQYIEGTLMKLAKYKRIRSQDIEKKMLWE